jgi:hypothetical protein
LIRWSKDTCIVASTHSAVFLDAIVNVGKIWSIGRSDGRTVVTDATEMMPSVLAELGVRPGDVLGADGLLIVEGPSDLDILSDWIPELRHNNIAVHAAGGGDWARQTDTLVRWLDQIDTLARPVLFIRDRDEMPDTEVAKLEATGKVAVLDRREIENYLLDPTAIATYLTTKGHPTSSAELSWLITQACAELQNEVVVKRVAARTAPIRLLSRPTVSALAHQGANREAVIEAATANIPDRAILDQIGQWWDEETVNVEAAWGDSATTLAPGADVLAKVFKACGLTFDKRRDGPAIAKLLRCPSVLMQRITGAFGMSAGVDPALGPHTSLSHPSATSLR